MDRKFSIEGSKSAGGLTCSVCQCDASSSREWMQIVCPYGPQMKSESAIVCSHECRNRAENSIAARRAPESLKKLGRNVSALRAFSKKRGEPHRCLRGIGLVILDANGWRLTRLGRLVLRLHREEQRQGEQRR